MKANLSDEHEVFTVDCIVVTTIVSMDRNLSAWEIKGHVHHTKPIPHSMILSPGKSLHATAEIKLMLRIDIK